MFALTSSHGWVLIHSAFQGSIFSAIGGAINSIISAIAGILETIVSVIVTVRLLPALPLCAAELSACRSS